MKILWVKTDFLHPTTRGGQIRTLEMLKQLHRQHEVHYVAFDDPVAPEGLARSSEYASYSYPVKHQVVPKTSPRFAAQLMQGLVSRLPVAGMRYRSDNMRRTIAELVSRHRFDAKVCDFLFPSVNIDDLRTWTLFQHNVETIIWERHAQAGRTPVHRWYFAMQARKMFAWEREVCRTVANVVAVSDVDASLIKSRFGVDDVPSVPTGVDIGYFEQPSHSEISHDLVFVGSMDWMPNIDGVRWFLTEVLPLIRNKRPDCRVVIVGRNPPPSLVELAKQNRVETTGTVPDVRPFLWQSAVSIVPLRVGGGTRLKIFEAMAAGTAVVSTTIGAEGLPAEHGTHIQIADTASRFAVECLDLLENQRKRQAISAAALQMVVQGYSWEQVTKRFERAIFLPVASPAR